MMLHTIKHIYIYITIYHLSIYLSIYPGVQLVASCQDLLRDLGEVADGPGADWEPVELLLKWSSKEKKREQMQETNFIDVCLWSGSQSEIWIWGYSLVDLLNTVCSIIKFCIICV